MPDRRPTASVNDAISVLQRDHAEIFALFERFAAAGDNLREEIAEHLCRALTVHAACEEELLYPAAHEALDDDTLVHESEIEHGSIRDLVELIEVLPIDDPRFAAAVKVLGEYVRHHVRIEEKQLFPRLRKTGLDLEVLGQGLHARRQDLLNEGFMPDDPGVSEEGEAEEDPDLVRRRRVGYAVNR
jgi:hemerythrin superfamily protein